MAQSVEEQDAAHVRGAGYKPLGGKRRRKHGGRKKGTPNRRTLEKLRQAEREAASLPVRSKLAVDHMDEMIEFLRGVVAKLVPWDSNGTPIEGRDTKIWFKAVEAFQGFLNMRAPYQSPRLSAVQIMPATARQRTTVNVTILNERGEKIWTDVPPDEELKQIEDGTGEDDGDAAA